MNPPLPSSETDPSPPTTAEGSRDSAVRAGVMTMLPLVAAYAPFALIVGATIAEHGEPWAGWIGSWLIFGGTAHIATLHTLDDAGAVVAILTGLLINTRLVVYSASLARRWTDQPRWFKLLAAGMIIDPTWALGERHAAATPDLRTQRRYFLAIGLTLGTGWSIVMAIGILARARLNWLDLDVVVPLCLLAIVGPGLRVSASRAVMVVAAGTALATAHFPDGTGLLLSVVAGAGAGLLVDRRAAS